LQLWANYKFYYTDTIISVFKGGNTSFQMPNNYNDIEKWNNIVSYFEFKILASGFSRFYFQFLLLSAYYYENGK
jgi:hypothetical protein